MKKEIKIIWQTAINLGFQFNETDAHEMWIAIKENTIKNHFKIREDRTIVYKCDTLQDCVNWLKKQELGLNGYYVEDIENDIEVDADDIIESFDNGEDPKDLTFF